MSDGQLHIPLTATDIYGSGGTPTPNIVLQHLPGGAFTITTKVTIEAERAYQQAGLILYGDDDNYMKLSLQGRANSPDRSANIIQFASELAGTATETNSSGLGADYPSTVWLRLSSENGLDVSASYSRDGQDYVQVAGTRSLQGDQRAPGWVSTPSPTRRRPFR
ncbi:DUF1349 domain-containing protein [Nocardioides sp. TF02-7]|nr:DUF1349 domain-containing protein [Nocardioides sp. TF02-7]UMG94729.1 DUF1349 domain-containing protein [Nocardioides sp. TF02-7]